MPQVPIIGLLKVGASIAVGAYVSYKAYRYGVSLGRQNKSWSTLEGLSYLVDNSDVDLAECIEVVIDTPPPVPEGSSAVIPKGMRKNKVRAGRRKTYANHVAKLVRAAYPNLGEGPVDREIARRKASAIMAEHGMRASQVVDSLVLVESLVFMQSALELEYSQLRESWWWFWTSRGLKPSRRA